MSGEVLLGTGSAHKLAELREILGMAGPAIRFIGLQDLPQRPAEPDESGASFEENATIKARAYAAAAGMLSLADDSGLCVDALGGAPGVHSAYFAGLPRDDAANNRKLVSLLAGVAPGRRTARFVCVMVLADAQGEILATTRGEVCGCIIDEPRGHGGFGYDPHFVLVPEVASASSPSGDWPVEALVRPEWVGRTTSELPNWAKNLVSHRGRAGRAMAERLRQIAARSPTGQAGVPEAEA